MSGAQADVPALPPAPSAAGGPSALHALYATAWYVGGVLALPALGVGLSLRARWRYALGERFGRYGADVHALAAQRPLWIHAASLGEVRAAAPLIEAVGTQFPDVPRLITTTSPEGHRMARELVHSTAVAMFPFDVPGAVHRALDAVRPRAILVLETELWPSFLRAARRRGTAVVIVNGRISDKSYARYLWARPFIRYILKDLRFAGMQSERDLERIRTLGAPPERSVVLGNLKYDALRSQPAAPDALRAAVQDAPVWIAGSTHPGEETLVAEAYRALRDKHPTLRLVVAPRHLQRVDDAERELVAAGLSVVRRSRLPGGTPEDVILLDTTGELAGAYGIASAVFVGGSWIERGGHNPLEPLAHGVPVLFGPHTFNFRDVTQAVLDTQGGEVIASRDELVAAVDRVLREPESARRRAEAARTILVERHGAVSRTLSVIAPLLT